MSKKQSFKLDDGNGKNAIKFLNFIHAFSLKIEKQVSRLEESDVAADQEGSKVDFIDRAIADLDKDLKAQYVTGNDLVERLKSSSEDIFQDAKKAVSLPGNRNKTERQEAKNSYRGIIARGFDPNFSIFQNLPDIEKKKVSAVLGKLKIGDLYLKQILNSASRSENVAHSWVEEDNGNEYLENKVINGRDDDMGIFKPNYAKSDSDVSSYPNNSFDEENFVSSSNGLHSSKEYEEFETIDEMVPTVPKRTGPVLNSGELYTEPTGKSYTSAAAAAAAASYSSLSPSNYQDSGEGFYSSISDVENDASGAKSYTPPVYATVNKNKTPPEYPPRLSESISKEGVYDNINSSGDISRGPESEYYSSVEINLGQKLRAASPTASFGEGLYSVPSNEVASPALTTSTIEHALKSSELKTKKLKRRDETILNVYIVNGTNFKFVRIADGEVEVSNAEEHTMRKYKAADDEQKAEILQIVENHKASILQEGFEPDLISKLRKNLQNEGSGYDESTNANGSLIIFKKEDEEFWFTDDDKKVAYYKDGEQVTLSEELISHLTESMNDIPLPPPPVPRKIGNINQSMSTPSNINSGETYSYSNLTMSSVDDDIPPPVPRRPSAINLVGNEVEKGSSATSL